MLSFLSPERIANFSARRPWLVLFAWVALIVVAGFGASIAKTDDSPAENPNSESERASRAIIDARGSEPATENIIVRSDTLTVDSPAFREFVAGLTAELRALDGTVVSVVNFYETNEPGLVSPDQHKTIISATLSGDEADAFTTVLPLLTAVEHADEHEDFRVMTVGTGSINHEIGEVFEKDLVRSEILGLPAALIVLVIVFGALVAAGVPLILSIIAIIVAVGISGVVSHFVPMGDLVQNMIVMIGLAVGIDYSLFIIERVREERASGFTKVDSITRAGGTASRAVVFSGFTVIIALAGLLIVPSATFHMLSVGAIAAVIGAVLAALTLLPAVLSLLGDKVNSLHLPGRGEVKKSVTGEGFWGRATHVVMEHPLIAIVATVAILGAAAMPAATMKLGFAGISTLPEELNSVQAFEVLDADFGAGRLAPVNVVIKGDAASDEVRRSVEALTGRLSQDNRFGAVGELEVSPDGGFGLLQIQVNGDSLSKDAQSAVRDLHDSYVPAAFDGSSSEVLIGGAAYESLEGVDSMREYLPIVITFVLSLSFLLLLVVFRSIVIPVKAIVMNLLSVGAAYGLIVAVFQHGIGADLLGFQQGDKIAAWLPVFLFAILFGLSMDYHVFLLSRIQERFMETGNNRESVASGLQSTAHIISGAAAIMVVVFGAFALGDMVEMQQMGFGLAVAVFLDATLIRSILVPASMELLGDRNWYLPSWLEWLPRINVEGGHTAPATAQGRRATAPAHDHELELAPIPVGND